MEPLSMAPPPNTIRVVLHLKDIKAQQSYREQTALHAFESLSRYFDVSDVTNSEHI